MSTTSPATSLQPPSVEAVIKRRNPLRNEHKEVLDTITQLDRLALWTVCWLGWNVLAPPAWQFDPPMAFVFWLFISNVIQILLMPLIMVGQNLQSRHGEVRAENDLEVNVRAEREIEAILRHLEYQNTMLIAMVQNLGIDVGLSTGTRSDTNPS